MGRNFKIFLPLYFCVFSCIFISNLKTFRLTYLFIFISVLSQAQNLSNFKTRDIAIQQDTIVLDSLSIVPNSAVITLDNANVLPINQYQLIASKGIIIFDKAMLNKKVRISYRTLSINLEKPSYASLYNLQVEIDSTGSIQTYRLNSPFARPNQNTYESESLNKSGYISRGLNFGNNQDVVVNSALNMQLSGQLTEGIKIKASITDNNIPIQPDGNTQQIQEFDKIFITLYNDNTSLTLGDFEINKPKGYFLNSNKKVMGATIKQRINFKKDKEKSLDISVSGAVAKGKFNRMTLDAKEGVQGPYQLRGANNETYIIVLAGTEKIYIDGELLKRGENHDYTIDYNLSELTFTTSRIITKDSRVVVEYEYSDKNYAKFTLANSNHFKTKNNDFWLNILSDHESKNQAINADYSDEEKQILALAGDDPFKAITNSYDSLGFAQNEVRYQMQSVAGYDSIFVYSTDENNAFYRVTFAFVGQGRGDYQQIKSSANGRVFEWIEPTGGVHKGSYLPVKLLIAPKSQQMITTGAVIRLKSFTSIDYEFAMSNYDANTYSTIDSKNDLGWAYKINLKQDIIQKDTSQNKLQVGFLVENINKDFTAFERYRSVEYTRDWNLGVLTGINNQTYGANLFWKKKDYLSVDYQIRMLKTETNYFGLRNNIYSKFSHQKWNANANASWLQTDFIDGRSNFIRSNSDLNYQLSKTVNVGIKEISEQNEWFNKGDSLSDNSYSFVEWEAFSKFESQKKNSLGLSFINREDKGFRNESLGLANTSQSVVLNTEIKSLKGQNLKANMSWRQVQVLDSIISKISKNEQNFLGKLEHNLRLYKNAISFRTFYEISSGLELKKEFAYIEVAAGQGVYQWIDYNGNGVQELDEFEKAVHQDQKKYIKINIPSQEYIKAYSNQFSETVNLYPYKVWRNKSGIRKFISKFNNLLSYKVRKKVQNDNFINILNPINHSVVDSSLLSLSQSVRNTFSFNKINPIYGVDYIYINHSTKSLLTNGFDSRSTLTHGINFRVNFNTLLSLNNKADYSEKSYSSEFFSSKDYLIKQMGDKLELSFQINNNLRIITHYQYKQKYNTLDFQKAELNELGLEFKYNVAQKSNIQINIEFFNFKYNDIANTSIAFEMLEGLLPGNNGKWTVLFQTQLSKFLQLNLSYLGRVAEDSKVIHNGQAQLRAFF